MFTDKELDRWCRRLDLSKRARDLVKKIRCSDPARLVRSQRGNVSGRYPSRKMGHTVQFDSHRCELPLIQELEYKESVLEFWDQPIEFELAYQSKAGRKVRTPHIPDFFILHEASAEFVECKTEQELIKLAEEKPNRFYQTEEGTWRCLPGEEYAQQFGFRYRVYSTSQINRVYVRNIEFLEDYLRSDSLEVAEESRKQITSIVANTYGIKLSDLLDRALESTATADDVYSLMVIGDICVDFSRAPLAERDRVYVFPDKESAQIFQSPDTSLRTPKGNFLNVEAGAAVIWDHKTWEISNVGETKIFLESETEKGSCLTHTRFEELVRQGEIRVVEPEIKPDSPANWLEVWNNARPKDRKEAERRFRILEPYLYKDKPLTGTEKERTFARWLSNYRKAEMVYENGKFGLLPNWAKRGIHKDRLPDRVCAIMDQRIDKDFETTVQKSRIVVYGGVVAACDEEGLVPPSYSTFCNRVRKRSRIEQVEKRRGRRAAYQHKTFYYWIEKDTPPHGDRPFEIAHADHTQLDIELICPLTGENLGRPWVSVLMDAYSRRFLAAIVTFDPPSYRSCLMLFRECVRRYGRLPQIIVVDGGPEFHGLYFENFAAAFQITVKTRPGAEPRFGSVGERILGTASKNFVHNLAGNTQIMNEVRKVTKSIYPKNLAVWPLGLFCEWFCAWAYVFYDSRDHWTLKQSPQEAYARALKLTGLRRHKIIPYDEQFLISSMPTTRKGFVKNVPDKGVKINRIYYWNDSLRNPELEGRQLVPRFDPFNAGVAYVYAKNRWLKCLSEYYTTFQGCTERQLKIAAAAINAQNKRLSKALPLSAKALHEFISSAEMVQSDLAAKRLLLQKAHDREVRPIFRAINGDQTDLGIQELSAAQNTRLIGTSTESVADSSKTPSVDFDDLELLEEYK